MYWVFESELNILGLFGDITLLNLVGSGPNCRPPLFGQNILDFLMPLENFSGFENVSF